MLSLFWQICDIIGLIFIVANSQILKINLTIWSHWAELIVSCIGSDTALMWNTSLVFANQLCNYILLTLRKGELIFCN